LAEQRGWPVAEEYVDNDISAYSGKPRPSYERMVADVQAGLRDAVVVYNLDRLTRRPVELEDFIAVCEAAGVREVATVTADIDLGNDDGLFMARIFAAFAAKESGRRSARQKRKTMANAEAGLPHGGFRRPFGYEDDKVTIRSAEAAVIKTVVSRFLAGESLRSLARWLDTEGIKTVGGEPWRTPTLRGMLRGGRIAGLREHRGAVVGPAVWAPIITEEQHRRILARMDERAASGRRSPRRYLLSGLLRCGKCGNRLYSSPRATTRRYVCSAGPDHGGCGRLTVVADPVERLVADAALWRLDTPELADALAGRAASDEQTAALMEAIAADQDRLDELSSAYGTGDVTMREWLTAKKPIEARKRDAEHRIARSTRADALYALTGTGSALRDQWDRLELGRQHAIVAAVIDHVVIAAGVNGARSLDPARVQIVWRT
jgi:DNA invertase Pin-like site-specific DNA recombinase